MNKQKKVKAWAVLDSDGGIKYPEVSLHRLRKGAIMQANGLNELPVAHGVKFPQNLVVPCTITYSIPNKKKK